MKNRQRLPLLWCRLQLNLVVENNRIIRAEAAGATNRHAMPERILRMGFPNDTRLLTPRLTQPMIRYRKERHSLRDRRGYPLHRPEAQQH